jgi:uncharacterized protein (TIGR00730 family)
LIRLDQNRKARTEGREIAMAKTPKTDRTAKTDKTTKPPQPPSGSAPANGTAGMAAPRPKACSILPDTTLGDDVALVAENMEAILSSPSYSLAQDDRELLDRTEMRGVRMLLELGKPELAFLEDNITSTVIVFGGTQIVERAAAERRLSEARRALARAQTVAAVPASAMAVAAVPASAMAAAAVPASAMESAARELKRAEQLLSHCHYYDEAREFARLVSIDNQCDDKRDYVVITGGGPGIMEAANRGAFDVGCKSIGLNIKLPSEQQPNPFITPELCFQFKYFALRKFHFILRAAAVVLFPGGFGTLDEMFETLTLRQTHRMQPVPIILFGRDYWSKVINFQYLADSGVISDEHLKLFTYAETPEEAWRQILEFHEAPKMQG